MKKIIAVLSLSCLLGACGTSSGIGGAGQVAHSKIHFSQVVECTRNGGCYPVSIGK